MANTHRKFHWTKGALSFGGIDYPIAAGNTSDDVPVGVGGYLTEGARYIVYWEKGTLQEVFQTSLESTYDRASKNRVVVAELTVPSNTVDSVTTTNFNEGNEVQIDIKADGQVSNLTNVLHIWKGNDALPAYSFNGDPDTGMYSDTADQIQFSTGGTQRLEISSSGVTATTFIGDLTGDVTGDVTGNADTATSATTLSGGLSNVTASGWFRGDVGSLAAPEFSFSVDTDTGIYRSAADHLSLSAGGQSITMSSAIKTSDSAYWIGIYPTNAGDGNAMDGTDTTPYVNIGTYPNTTTGWNYQYFNAILAGYHVMAYDGSETQPTLYFNSDIDTGFYYADTGYWGFTSGGSAGGDQTSAYIGEHTFNTTNSSGSNDQTVDMQVVGLLGVSLYIYAYSVYPKVHNSGDLGSNTRRWDELWVKDIDVTNPVVVSSDRSLKDNIQPTNLGLDFINDLNPVSYKWKDETVDTSTHYGIVAQDVVDTLNNSGIDSLDDFAGITYNTDNNLYGARYQEFIPILMKAVQELSAEIKELKEKN
jgi:hypothetical protein